MAPTATARRGEADAAPSSLPGESKARRRGIRLLALSPQQVLAGTHDDRAEEQMALVDQARGDGLAGTLGTTDGDVRSRVVLVAQIESS